MTDSLRLGERVTVQELHSVEPHCPITAVQNLTQSDIELSAPTQLVVTPCPSFVQCFEYNSIK